MVNDFDFLVGNTIYPVKVTRKRMRYIRYRFRDGTFLVSCPYLVTKMEIVKGLRKYGGSLIQRSNKDKENPAIGENFMYILGEKYITNNSGVITFTNGKTVKYSSKEDLYKKLKPLLLEIVTTKVRYYENLMHLVPYKIRVRDMKTRYGSNSKSSRTVCFALLLVHYSIPIIESVVVHELCHDTVFNHSSKFYKEVYKYCPDYDKLHNDLRKKKYHD